ncbi:MAG: glycosyltransferase [Geobacteraceae bacterium]|nr:glycosyltransferase [Geobacteraceae bacterium]
MPKVSVIVPAFNSARYIQDALVSVLAQGYQDLEIIVVDDASTDNTAEVVTGLDSHKISYTRLPENHGGPSTARNIGIKNSRGDYIVLFDSDDLMLPGRIEYAVSAMDEHPEVGMVCSDAVKFDAIKGNYAYNHLNPGHYGRFRALETRHVGSNLSIIDKQQAYSCLFYENYVQTSSVTIRKKVFDDIGYFDESLPNAEDWDMWFRISHSYDLGFIDTVCIRYRVRADSITTRSAHTLGINQIRVLRNRIESHPEDEVCQQAHALIAGIYADMGYSYRCENQMKLAREHYLMSLKEKFNGTVLLQGLIALFDGNTIHAFKNIDLVRKFKALVTSQ